MTYQLIQEPDGTFWIYESGVRHSRYGITPVDAEERRVLNAIPDLLNKQPMGLTLKREAYYLYLMKLW